jgi:hypothetical protein
VRETATPFSLRLPDDLRGVTPELAALARRAYVRGLSVRDVEGLYAEVFGGTFAKSAASRAAATLQAEFDAWRLRDLSECQILYLFLDGQFHAVRSETTEKEGILAAYALLEDGRMVLLHLALGPRESTDAWVSCLHDRPPSLAPPLPFSRWQPRAHESHPPGLPASAGAARSTSSGTLAAPARRSS